VIVMERPAHCLDLFSFLQIQPQGRVKEKVARKIFRDVMRGVDYLDKRGILHNDIKPENILLEVEPADKSSKRPRCSERKQSVLTGTMQYCPPEYDSLRTYYRREANVWALGCTLYEMLTGRVAYKGPSQAANQPLQIPKFLSMDACELLQKLLEKEAFWRTSLESISQDPWL
ncbi:predicted protein, partial [Nematostella vectensis]